MIERTINILGTKWKVKIGSASDYPVLENGDGFADPTTKEIVVDDMKRSEGQLDAKGDLVAYQKQTLRHEVIHAFMEESGLSHNFEHKSIGIEETTVDWFAIQAPKIFSVFQELEIL